MEDPIVIVVFDGASVAADKHLQDRRQQQVACIA